MECEYCGGPVEWKNKIANILYTVCLRCGETNVEILKKEEKEEECPIT